ncbi:MAG: hypothetical protein H0T89_00500 [Deltaproteobacteria bacterium]|nr:hypothetical protein [Deltaproteobacteria bacterium]MDQ3300368.1 hypothetical protein [Myxococcota bacterium]
MWRAVLLMTASASITSCTFEAKVPPGGVPGDASRDGVVDASVDAPPPLAVDASPDAPPSVIACPGSMCGSVCCDGTCINAVTSICSGRTFRCDGPEDCAGAEVCCNDQSGSSCTTAACNSSPRFEVCHTGADCSFNCSDCSFRQDYGQKVCCE